MLESTTTGYGTMNEDIAIPLAVNPKVLCALVIPATAVAGI
jgi:hypothetical protein